MKIGDYVRTNCGLIAKVQSINDYNIAIKNTCCNRLKDKYFTFPNEDKIYEITKASFNLIDLIEVGDYVNGYRTDYIVDGKLYTNRDEVDFEITEKEIKEVLTKEQYEREVYRV